MEYNLGFLAGGILAAIIGVVFIYILRKYTRTDNATKCKYDERQQLVRGIGFKYGFFTFTFYNIAAAALISLRKKQYIDHAALMLIGILISTFVYAVFCIWKEGYFSLNENPKYVIITFSAIALLNFGIGWRSYLRGLMFENGVLTSHCINFLCGILIILLFPVMAAKHISKQKEEEE